ncbi:MAG: HlyD family efflux transporter periplasmic adaptor subunit [Oscillochloris sp.]|nr:HlyD family efflux transporter periplasmic adaptor subunit [Oscillochloris sp.]
MTAETSSQPARRPRIAGRQLVLGFVGLLVVAAAIWFGVQYLQDAARYVSTDDAMVDSNMVPIAPIASGTLSIWQIKPGETVRAGQVIGEVRPSSGSSYINITAPIDGTILRVDGKEGQVVAQAQALAYVANLNAMYITAYIDEGLIHKVHVGESVDVTIDTTGSTVYHGTVNEVLGAAAGTFALIPASDRSNGNFTKVTQRVEVHIDIGPTTDISLYPGVNAYVRIHVQ